jgi:hypothetical protein
MPCTKPAGDEELACQRKASNRSADTMPVNPAKQHTTIQRIALLITPLLFIFGGPHHATAYPMDKANMPFSSTDVTTSITPKVKVPWPENAYRRDRLLAVYAPVQRVG